MGALRAQGYLLHLPGIRVFGEGRPLFQPFYEPVSENPLSTGGFVMAKRILLADDSITIQKVISITFASEDYDLVVVGDGEAAIQKARDLKPDLIMADGAMPGKTGYEGCSFAKN